jgi:predicted SAM-dependent methyltransferase
MKLHLGCGKRNLPGFVHIDIADFPHIDYRAEVNFLPFIEDQTVDEIYSSHTFEYFDRLEAPQVLSEWQRVLKPGGRLYLTVPNIDSLIQIYVKSGELNDIIGPLFGRWLNAGDSPAIFHKTVWNEKDLRVMLLENNFSDVKVFDPISYLANVDPAFDDYSLAFSPHMDKSGIQVSLAISCKRPKV